jgi:septal ring-binding cell division protein DamX
MQIDEYMFISAQLGNRKLKVYKTTRNENDWYN